MQLLPGEERFLRRALELARDAAAFASPNPTVGCVIAREGQTLGEGAHFYDNRDHAEVAALKDAASQGDAVRGATAYVTLEPCSHHGRTGPCADALVTAGIARCVVATLDPNPLVRGQGIARLRAGGVDVWVAGPELPWAHDARRLNDAFAFSIQHGRPFVTLKAALSREGHLAPQPVLRNDDGPYWLTGAAARGDVQQLRHAADAILTGIGTVLADNPSLTDRTGLARLRPLLRIVLDSQLRFPVDSALLQGVDHDLLVVAGHHAERAAELRLRELGAEVVRVPSDATSRGLDLQTLMRMLQERQIRSLLCEGGSTLNGSLLGADLVDKVILYRSQTSLGEDAVPFASDGPAPPELEAKLTAVHRVSFPRAEGPNVQDVRVDGYLHDPWQGIDGYLGLVA